MAVAGGGQPSLPWLPSRLLQWRRGWVSRARPLPSRPWVSGRFHEVYLPGLHRLLLALWAGIAHATTVRPQARPEQCASCVALHITYRESDCYPHSHSETTRAGRDGALR